MTESPAFQTTAVMVATPCFGGLLTQGYVESVINLTHYAGHNGFNVSLAMLGSDAMITRCRNTLAAAFLDNPTLTHLMFIDADIKFDPESLGRLLRFDEEVVAGFYPLKIQDWSQSQERQTEFGETVDQSALSYVGTLCEGEELEVRGDFATAIYAGTGFLLIKRSVFEKLTAAYPELQYKAIHAYPRRPGSSAHQFALFDSLIEPGTRAYLSEDYGFCHRWRAIGGKIWLDTRSRLTHIGSLNFIGDTTQRLAGVREVQLTTAS